jgi:hypothetical protein
LSDDYDLTNQIRFVYVCRDSKTVTEFVVEAWSLERVAEFEIELADLRAHYEDGTLPPMAADDYWLCAGYCDYRTLCRGADWKPKKKSHKKKGTR